MGNPSAFRRGATFPQKKEHSLTLRWMAILRHSKSRSRMRLKATVNAYSELEDDDYFANT
jgi:hypothetical protein